MNGVKRMKKWIGVLLSALIIAGNYAPQTQAVAALPDAVQVRAGELCQLSVEWPYSLAAADETMQVLSSSDAVLGVIGERRNTSELTVSLFGLPVKKIEMHVQEERVLYPGGENIGAAMNTQGVLVVGTSDLTGAFSPARLAGLKAGDVITQVNGKPLHSIEELTALVNEGGSRAMPLTVRRGEGELRLTLEPRQDGATGSYRIGAWVRDSTAGVGTLSFYGQMEEGGSLRYGALGHAITDADTQQVLTLSRGELMEADVVDVRKGQSGVPGELKGSFLREHRVLGNIRLNNQFGIYGQLDSAPAHPLYPDGLPIGRKDAVHTGPASILCTVNGTSMKEYAIEIVEVARQSAPAQRSMVLRVTDEQLLEKTGGIVQGMSGSPILQDGRLIGAVTHVFVNDPAMGYGLFIEWMLQQE